MAKIQNISEFYLTLGFTEFEILEKYRKGFNESELGSFHSSYGHKAPRKVSDPVDFLRNTCSKRHIDD